MAEQSRFNMVEQQIRTWDVLDVAVLDLFNIIKRENYVPLNYRGLAFADIEVPLEHGEFMLSPKLEGRILQELKVKKTETAYHIGTGSGFFAALLAKLSKHVTTVDIHLNFIQRAKLLHRDNGLSNLHHHQGNGFSLLQVEPVSFDVIVLTGSTSTEPIGLREKLNVGGRLFFIVGEEPMMQAKIIERYSDNQYAEHLLFDCVVPKLSYALQSQAFQF